MRRRTRLSALLGGAILLAACGGAGGPAGDPVDDTTGTTDGGASDDTAAPTPSGDGGETMAEFFGWEQDDPEAAQAEYRDQESRIQESIRRCMAEQGFEYQPVLPPEDSFQVWDETDEEERVRTQGFGITTWYGNEEEFGGGPGEEWIDPNQEAVEAMSEGEQQAWYDALYGTQEEQEEDMQSEVDSETGETIYYSEGYGAGCQGEAYEAEYGNVEDTESLWEEIQPAMDAMYQQVEADPRVVEANEAWAACMADAGYEVATRNDMWESVYSDFQARFDAIVGPNGGYVDPFDGWTEDEINAFFEEKTQEEIDAFFEEAESTRRTDIDDEALAALQQEEIDMAVADWECAADMNDLYTEVSAEYEADFVAANRAVLEQIREAQGG
jgi:hypothetical protein